MTEHPDAAEVGRLLDGELAPEMTEAWLHHLASCEACLELADSLWAARRAAVGTSETEQPMPEHSVQAIERRLFQRIHAAGAGSQLAWLMTDGFVNVVVVLMRPIVFMIRQLDSTKGVPR